MQIKHHCTVTSCVYWLRLFENTLTDTRRKGFSGALKNYWWVNVQKQWNTGCYEISPFLILHHLPSACLLFPDILDLCPRPSTFPQNYLILLSSWHNLSLCVMSLALPSSHHVYFPAPCSSLFSFIFYTPLWMISFPFSAHHLLLLCCVLSSSFMSSVVCLCLCLMSLVPSSFQYLPLYFVSLIPRLPFLTLSLLISFYLFHFSCQLLSL